MYFRSSSDILAGRTKSVQIDIAILDIKKIYKYAIYRSVRKVSVDEEERYYRI